MKVQDILVQLRGRLTKNQVVKKPKKARVPVTEIAVAVNGPGGAKVVYVDASIFGPEYVELLKAASKGTEVIVLGRLRQHRWEDDLGMKHSRHSVLASHVSIVPSAPEQDEVVVDEVSDDELTTEVVDEAITETLAQ